MMVGGLSKKVYSPSVAHDEVKPAELLARFVDQLVAKGLAPQISWDSDQFVLHMMILGQEVSEIFGVWLLLGKVVNRHFGALSSQSNHHGSSDA